MEVKARYKQTDVGVIPTDWEIHTIGDSLHLVNGRAFKPQDWKDSGLPIVRIQNLNDDESPFNYWQGPVEDRHRIEAGDLLFAWSGTTGTSFGARVWNGPTAVLNQHIFKVVPDHRKLTLRYALLVLRSVQEHIVKRAHGFKASFVHVKKSDLVGVQLPLPPTKAEQEAIAEALSDAEAFIEALEQLLAKKRQLKQGAMQQLLTGKKRLPGFTGDWDVKPLGELAGIVMGQSPSSAHYNYKGDGLPLIQGNADISDRQTIKRVFTTEVTKRGRSGDILMSVRAPVGQISRATFDVCLGRGVCALAHSTDFLYHALIVKEPTWATLSKGSTFDSVNSTDVRAFEVEIPTEESDRTAIADILSDMDAEIGALEAKLIKARQVKVGMRQELLTGNIRLV
jgi:type I restriction enzyme S subunit